MAMRNGREWADGRRRDRERADWAIEQAARRDKIRRESEEARLLAIEEANARARAKGKTPGWLLPDEVPDGDGLEGLDELFEEVRSNMKSADVVVPQSFASGGEALLAMKAKKDFAGEPMVESDAARTNDSAFDIRDPLALLYKMIAKIEAGDMRVLNHNIERRAFDEMVLFEFKLVPVRMGGVASPSETDMGLGNRPASTPTQRARETAEAVIKGASLGVPVRKIDL